MTDYTQNVSFAPKDALTTGDPNKRITGTQFDAELAEISTAIASKEDSADKGAAGGYCGLDGSGLVDPSDLPAATIAAKGAVELATGAESITGTDATRAVTPDALADVVADLLQSATFTGDVTISNTAPTLRTYESDAAADEKYWRVTASGGDLFLQSLTDAYASQVNALRINRTGTTIDSIALTATSVTVNGTSVNAAGILTSGTLADAVVAESNVTQHEAALSIAETQITDGTVFPRLASAESITGAWTFSAIGNSTVTGTLTKSTKGAFPYYASATQAVGQINVSTSAASGTPGAGDLWIQYTA